MTLTPSQREALGRQALVTGVSATARAGGINPRTVRKWRDRVRRKQSLQSPNTPLTPGQQKALLAAAPRSREESLRECRQRSGVACSLATVSRVLRAATILMPEIYLVTYRQVRGRRTLRVVCLHYSIPYRCASPLGPVRLVTRQVVPFYTPGKKDAFLYQGEIRALKDPLYAREIRPHLGPQKSCSAWFIATPRSRSEGSWHVIQAYQNDLPYTYCQRVLPPEKGAQILLAAQIQTTPFSVCRRCQNKLIPIYQHTRTLQPPFLSTPKLRGSRGWCFTPGWLR